ncbi:MAG: hypothetical protein ABH885_01415 [Candidatus Omnitrophota bacterium]
MIVLAAEFMFCSVLIACTGSLAARYGHTVARIMNWEAGFVGVLFLAVATSMPEVFTSLSTVPEALSINKIDLGFGDAIGSLIVNLIFLAILDIVFYRGSILSMVTRGHLMGGIFTVSLLTVLVVFAVARACFDIGLSFMGVGLESILIIAMYGTGMWRLVMKRHVILDEAEAVPGEKSEAVVWAKFAVLLFLIFVLGVWLANIGSRISGETRINESFVGNLILAASTSLPELSVSLAALRMGSADMCVGNIVGSNFFDVCIISGMDILYRKGPILADIGRINIFAGALAMVLTVILCLGLAVAAGRGRRNISWAALSILFVGAAGYFVIYRCG